MKIIDLSHVFNDQISVFSKKGRPEITWFSTHETEGYAEKKITLYSHNSTHVDAPFHIFPDAPSLDQLPLESYYGPALVLDCQKLGPVIKTKDISIFKNRVEKVEFLLIMTGWYKKWNTREYKLNYPVLSVDAAEWLMQFQLKGIGLDTISADEIDSTGLPVHKVILGNNRIIIENLTNLDELPEKDFIFSCFPIRFERADGSPARAVGIL